MIYSHFYTRTSCPHTSCPTERISPASFIFHFFVVILDLSFFPVYSRFCIIFKTFILVHSFGKHSLIQSFDQLLRMIQLVKSFPFVLIWIHLQVVLLSGETQDKIFMVRQTTFLNIFLTPWSRNRWYFEYYH